MKNENELYDLIVKWQNDNDSEFISIPIDNHAHLILNYKTHITTFIFSNINKRNQCICEIPNDMLSRFQYVQKNITKEGIDEIIYFYVN